MVRLNVVVCTYFSSDVFLAWNATLKDTENSINSTKSTVTWSKHDFEYFCVCKVCHGSIRNE